MAAAVARSLADDGRLGDARYLKASRFNLQGAYNDDASRRNAVATRHLAVNAGLAGQFRTPTLRNVAVTAPYFHDGQTERLTDALQHPQPWHRRRVRHRTSRCWWARSTTWPRFWRR